MRKKAQSGYASVLTMLLLVLGFTLCAWLFSAVSNGTSVTRNELTGARAMVAAESGLASAMYQLREVTRSTGFKRTSNDPAVLETDTLRRVCEVMQALSDQQIADSNLHLIAGTVTSFTATSDPTAPRFLISPVTLSDGSTYSAEMGRKQYYKPAVPLALGFTVQVIGEHAGARRTIFLDLSPEIVSGSSSMDYAIASKGYLNLPDNPHDGILRYDPNATPPITSDVGEEVNLSRNGPGFLRFDDSPQPEQDILFPDTFLDPDVYGALETMRTSGALSTASNRTLNDTSNVYIPPAGHNAEPVVFPDNSVISGIVYVAWPNVLEFGKDVKFEGVIVYARPTQEQIDAIRRSSDSRILLGRTENITSDATQAQISVKDALTNSSLTPEQRVLVAESLETWSVHAPYTDFELQNGLTTETRTFEGNFHVRNLGGAGTGNAEPSNLIIRGQILCEGSVDLTGNRVFCIEPPDQDDNPDAERRLRLGVSPGGYREFTE